MNLTKPFALIFIALFVMISCSKTSNYQYEKLEMLIETQPQVGLDSVCHLIKNDDGKDKYTSNKLALLKYIAEIKCNISHESDSTIKEIFKYMESNGSIGDRIAANYCIGITYIDTKQLPLSMTHIKEAVSLSEANVISKTDSIYLANAHLRLGRMNNNMEQYAISLYHTKKAIEIKKALGIEDILSYHNMANVYYSYNMIDSAEVLYKKCAMDFVCNNKIKNNLKSIGEQLYFFSRTGNAKMSKITLDLLKSVDIDSLPPDALSNITQYYIHIELNTDSCIYYSKLAYETEKDYEQKANHAKNLSILYSYVKDYENAAIYAYKCFLYEDSTKKIYKKSDVASTQNQLQQQELDRMRSSIHEEEVRRNQYLAYGATAIMTILAILGFSLYIQSKKKNRIMAEKEQIESDKKEIEEKHQQLQEVMDADNKLRAESAKDISAVIAHLNTIADDGRMALTEDIWDDIFTAVDKLYPNFRNHVISYYPVIENKDLIIIYLVMLGMKQADVARLFNNARSVVHRKFHRIEEKLGSSISDIIDDYKKRNS